MPTLRSHPDLSSWPPGWGGSYTGADRLPIGEVGVLRAVRLMGRNGPNPSYLRVDIEFNGLPASGIVTSGNEALLTRVESTLSAHIGVPVAELGDMEVT
jgi:hypothetical protein